MWNIKLTSKNQATFPKALLEEMHAHPGERLGVVREVRNGRVGYRLLPPGGDWSWIGSARPRAKGESHRMEDIRRSIGRAIGKQKGR